MKKKFLTFFLAILMLIAPEAHVPAQALKTPIDDTSVFLKQEVRGTCTLSSTAMMLRRRALIDGDSAWSGITEGSIRSSAWIDGIGLRWSFTYSGISVGSLPFSGDNKSLIISLLDEHPEGIVVHNASIPHAVLITDYTDGVFYCSDPSGGVAPGRIPLDESSLGTSQDSIINALNRYWYVTNRSGLPNNVTIRFNPLGGMLETDVIELVGTVYTELPVPEREGHIFTGWFTMPDIGIKVYEGAKVYSLDEHTLYAGWTTGNSMSNFRALRQYEGVFSDLKESDWFYEYVEKAYCLGLIDGVSSHLFDPSGTLTLAQTIKLAACLNSIYARGLCDFPQSTPWYETYALYAVANGISFNAGGGFNTAISRADFAVILATSLPDELFQELVKVDDGAIPDISLKDEYAPSVYKLYRAGILAGSDSKGSFRPGDTIKRSEAAAIISRMSAIQEP